LPETHKTTVAATNTVGLIVRLWFFALSRNRHFHRAGVDRYPFVAYIVAVVVGRPFLTGSFVRLLFPVFDHLIYLLLFRTVRILSFLSSYCSRLNSMKM